MTTATKPTLWTLRNSFHGTEVRVRAVRVRAADHDPARIRLSNGQFRKADKALCGMVDCSCGGLHRDHDCQMTTGNPDTCDYDVAVSL